MSKSNSLVGYPVTTTVVANGGHHHHHHSSIVSSVNNGKPPSAPIPAKRTSKPATANSVTATDTTQTAKSETGSFTSKFCFLSWNEDETHCIREFIKRYTLPRVVRVTNVEETSIIKALTLPPDVDISQPILLYKKYRPIKIQGKCLKLHKNGKLKDVGSSFILPDSFPGWFSLLTPDGKECAMTLTSMGQIAAARVPAFLTKFEVPVYKLTESHEAGVQSVYVRSSMRPGSVLRLLGIWADMGPGGPNQMHAHGHGHSHSLNPYQHGQFSSSSYFAGGGGGGAPTPSSRARSLSGFGGRLVARSLSTQPPHSYATTGSPQFQYIQCLNQENEVLFIPFTATGVFYPIAPRGGRNPQHIYPLSAIARLQRLPARVKMVFGALPQSLPDFSGTFELENVTTDDLILACTLLKDKPTLFELDPTSDLFLSQMNSDDLFIKSASYQSAIAYCRAEGDAWRRTVKPAAGGKIFGKNRTITAAVLKKSLRLRSSNNSSSNTKNGSSNMTSLSPFTSYTSGSGSAGNGGSSPYTSPAVSKLSQLFRPNSFGPPPTRGGSGNGSSGKNGLKRSKSFNIETQCVSLSLAAQDELGVGGRDSRDGHGQFGQQKQRGTNLEKLGADTAGKRLSSIFNFMSSNGDRKYNSSSEEKNSGLKKEGGIRLGAASNQYTSTEFLSSAKVRLQLHNAANVKNGVEKKRNDEDDDIPYGRVIDELNGDESSNKKSSVDLHEHNDNDDDDEEVEDYESENIYAEIPGDELLKLNANLRLNFHLRDSRHIHRHSILVEGIHHNHHNHHHHGGSSSNMSSLIKGGGGSDGAFSGGTFSSSNPSSTEEDIYDNIF